jgi:hypothetical protein
MTTTQARVLGAVEKWEAEQAAAGRKQCPCCSNWHRGAECDACQPTATMTAAMIVGLAMLAR